MRHSSIGALTAVCATICGCLLLASPALADFGIKSVSATAVEADGSVDLQAASHPFAYKLSLTMNQDEAESAEGTLRSVIADLPAGLVGNPQAVPRCEGARFEGQIPSCPSDTQIGVAVFRLDATVIAITPIYNLNPPVGVAARIGFSAAGLNALQDAELRSSDYGVSIFDTTIPQTVELATITETIWGVPADSGHDPERKCGSEGESFGCPTDAPPRPFLTLPTSCTGPLKTTFHVESVEAPGVVESTTTTSVDDHGVPAGLESCEEVPFEPSFSAQPETSAADSPTGLGVEIRVPQNEDPEGLAAAHLKNVSVSLPSGIAVNPSAANGLLACPLQGPEGINLPISAEPEAPEPAAVGEPAKCPDASKVGTVEIDTPLLDHPVPGSVYLAKQGENPFGSLLALYIALDDPVSGVVVKLAGRVELDPVTGQLKATFANNPQLPFEALHFNFFGGPRATLTSPSTCGEYTTTAQLTPWTAPEGATVSRTSAFSVNSSPTGGACASSEGQLPHAARLQAGTVTPLAGTFSPLVFRVSREDGSQRFGSVTASLPEGLLGNLAGVAYCSDAQIAAAAARSGEGEGAVEQASPSCPEASQVGVVKITAGAGSEPYAVQGKAYLAGPYKNAPLSLAVITPAIAGPFDLGTVVVRVALYIDPITAQISAVSDPLPTILDGIPLDIRSVSLEASRAGFTFNPTSCEAMSINGQAISTLGQTAGLSNRFQVGGCQGLPFKPSLTTSTVGKGSRANGASLTVKVAQQRGEANIHKVELTIPSALPARLSTLHQACTEAQFNSNPAGCPPGAVIGTAKATTPILNAPLAGPAILVSHGGAAFPDVVFLLQANERGSVIRIDLEGKTDIKKGVTYSRFETVPDAPITSFETNLPEGPHSIFGVNIPESANYSLCGQKLSIPATITGQNGAQVRQDTGVAVEGCSNKLGLISKSVKKRTLKLVVYAPEGGKVSVSGKGVSSGSTSYGGRESKTITVTQKKGGKLKTNIRLRFTSSKGKTQSKAITVSFKK